MVRESTLYDFYSFKFAKVRFVVQNMVCLVNDLCSFEKNGSTLLIGEVSYQLALVG